MRTPQSAATPRDNKRIQGWRVLKTFLRLKNQARFRHEGSVRQSDCDYFITAPATAFALWNLRASESLGWAGQINCDDSVKSYETNPFWNHHGFLSLIVQGVLQIPYDIDPTF
jgi:hypothetical protein